MKKKQDARHMLFFSRKRSTTTATTITLKNTTRYFVYVQANHPTRLTDHDLYQVYIIHTSDRSRSAPRPTPRPTDHDLCHPHMRHITIYCRPATHTSDRSRSTGDHVGSIFAVCTTLCKSCVKTDPIRQTRAPRVVSDRSHHPVNMIYILVDQASVCPEISGSIKWGFLYVRCVNPYMLTPPITYSLA
ncbi:unnamed protein product [Laminaria digitata]